MELAVLCNDSIADYLFALLMNMSKYGFNFLSIFIPIFVSFIFIFLRLFFFVLSYDTHGHAVVRLQGDRGIYGDDAVICGSNSQS